MSFPSVRCVATPACPTDRLLCVCLAVSAGGDDGLTPRRASQRLTLTRRASFYNAEDGSRHFARARHTVLAERLQQSAPAPAAVSHLPADPRPLMARLFGEPGRADSADSVSSLAWGLDAVSPAASASASVADVSGGASGRGGAGGGGGGGGGDDTGDGDGDGDGDGGGRVPDTPSRRVQFDLTPAKGGGRGPARGMTPRSILKATPGCASSPDLFGTPQKTTPRVHAKRKRLFSTTPSKAERATPPPPPGVSHATTPPRALAADHHPAGASALFTPPRRLDLAGDPVAAGSKEERTPDKRSVREAATPSGKSPHSALLCTQLRTAAVVLTPLRSPRLQVGSPRRAVLFHSPGRRSPRRTPTGTPSRSETLLTPRKSPAARPRPDLGTPSRRLVAVAPSVSPAAARTSAPGEAAAETETAAETVVAQDSSDSGQSSPVVSRRRSRSGSASRQQGQHSSPLLSPTLARDREQTPPRTPPQIPPKTPPRTPLQTPPRTPLQTPPKTPPRTPSRSPLRHSPRSPVRSSPRTTRAQVQTPPRAALRSPPRTPPRTSPRPGDVSPCRSPVRRPNLQCGAELELRSPVKEPPADCGRSVSPDIGPAGDGLGAALLARLAPLTLATSTPAAPAATAAAAAEGMSAAMAVMAGVMPQFSPLGTTASSVDESPSKIDIGGILDLLDEPSEPTAATMSTTEFMTTMESYLDSAEPVVESAAVMAAADAVEPGVTAVQKAEVGGVGEAVESMEAEEAAAKTDPVAAQGRDQAEASAAVTSQLSIRPCSVVLSPLLLPLETAFRSGGRRASEPSSPVRQLRHRALRQCLSEVLTDRPASSVGQRGGCDRQESGSDDQCAGPGLVDSSGDSPSSRLGDSPVRVAGADRTSCSVPGSGESFVPSSTEGNDASMLGRGVSNGLVSVNSTWDSMASSGGGQTSSLADISAQSSARSRRSRGSSASDHRPSSPGTGESAAEEAAPLESGCQSPVAMTDEPQELRRSGRSIPEVESPRGGSSGEWYRGAAWDRRQRG